MNGPAHYLRAEALLDSCQPPYYVADYDDQGRLIEPYEAEPNEEGEDVHRNALAAAQVHATLALVALLVDTHASRIQPRDHIAEWAEATR